MFFTTLPGFLLFSCKVLLNYCKSSYFNKIILISNTYWFYKIKWTLGTIYVISDIINTVYIHHGKDRHNDQILAKLSCILIVHNYKNCIFVLQCPLLTSKRYVIYKREPRFQWTHKKFRFKCKVHLHTKPFINERPAKS